MSALVIYIEGVQAEMGLRRQERLRALRWYIRQTTTEEIKHAVNLITDINKLKILWEAGLNPDLQEMVLRRVRDLSERRR